MSKTNEKSPAWLKRMKWLASWTPLENTRPLFIWAPHEETIAVVVQSCCASETVKFFADETLEGCHEVLNKIARDVLRKANEAHREQQEAREQGKALSQRLSEAGFPGLIVGHLGPHGPENIARAGDPDEPSEFGPDNPCDPEQDDPDDEPNSL